MKFSYNEETELVAYTINDGYSCFKVSKEAVFKIDKTLLDGEKRDDDILFSQLQKVFHKEMYKTYKGFTVDKNASTDILAKVYEAYSTNSKVMIEYKDGWESYPSEEDMLDGAIVSEDGKCHVLKIGKSTGEKPIFLSIHGSSLGGESLCFAGSELPNR